jgi:hypothetical protein
MAQFVGSFEEELTNTILYNNIKSAALRMMRLCAAA